MPTTKPRHTITETPPVKQALDELRAKLAEGERIDYAELVTLGARAKARQLPDRDEEARRAREELAEWIRSGSFPFEVDLEAAEEVKGVGLTANYDE